MTITKRFSLGKCVATPAALRAIRHAAQEPTYFLSRHHSGDWGEESLLDSDRNDRAVTEGGQIMSVYKTLRGVRLYVVTNVVDEDGSVATTICLPEEQ